MTTTQDSEQDGTVIGRYDEEDSVCTGCGKMIDSGSWCHSCTYSQ